ncbi:hypothetical protein [Nocardiopsis alkaliphila]|uniref:hypothetical protein n=1 Tax=Nocardiopsis alkaliphila TaxID=225762 RepID=UPI000344D3F5|nr:hypothetical protein [Nocardiopsis alkaliphila]
MPDELSRRPVFNAAGPAVIAALVLVPLRVFMGDTWLQGLAYAGLFGALFFGIAYVCLRWARG